MTNFSVLFAAMRPKQWTKNLLVFAALLFSKELFNVNHITETILAFILFCLAASAIYVVNDIGDREEDAYHPTKKLRPIASGKVSIHEAQLLVISLLTIVLVTSLLLLPLSFLFVLILYVVLNFFYSSGLKHVVIVDLLIVATGFVLRAIAGAVAINVSISPWLLATTFFAALFIILGKRRHELLSLGEVSKNHRSVLGEYSQEMLDAFLIIATTASIIMYVLYTMAERTIEIFSTANLIYTVIFVVYGIFRAYYLIYQKQQGGAPTEMFLTDRQLQVNMILWVIAVASVIYAG